MLGVIVMFAVVELRVVSLWCLRLLLLFVIVVGV